MHIVYVIAPHGGPQTYVETLLPWFLKQGNTVSVINLSNVPLRFNDPVDVFNAKESSLHYYLQKFIGGFNGWPLRLRAYETEWAIFKALRKIEKRHPVDLVEIVEGVPLILISRFWKTVVRIHGSSWAFRHFCQDGDSKYDRYLIRMEKKQLSRASAVSTMSLHFAEHVSQACNYALDKIKIIYYPIDTKKFYPNNFNFPPTVTVVGRIEKRKGTHILIKAMESVWEVYPNISVNLIGEEGDLKKSQLLESVKLENRKRIHFTGYLGHDELPDYYRKTTLYVTPTRYEGFGYTLLEAMACGVPVVATSVGAIPEVVDNGLTGLLVDAEDPKALANAILSLLSEESKRKEMGEQSRRKVLNTYTIEKIGKQTLDFYEKVLGR